MRKVGGTNGQIFVLIGDFRIVSGLKMSLFRGLDNFHVCDHPENSFRRIRYFEQEI